MRIAHLTSFVSSKADGLRAVVEALSGAQQELGHDVTVHALADRARPVVPGVDWTGAPLNLTPTFGPRSIGYSPRIYAGLRDAHAEIVHAHGLWMAPPYAAVRARRAQGIPFLISPHGMLNPVALAESRWKKAIAKRLYQNRIFAAASLMHVTCEKEVEEVRDYGLRQPVAIIPNGVARPSTTFHHKTKTVVSISRLHHLKGIHRLVSAWARIEQQYPDWNLRIAGPDQGGYTARLRDQARSLGITRMELTGPVFGTERERIMSEAGVFVLPSLAENFGMTIAESLAAGTPTIVSNKAPWAGIVEEQCGWWIEPTVDSIVATLQQAMNLPEETRREMGKRGQRWVTEQFIWQAVARKLTAVYSWLLSPEETPPEWVVLD